MIRYAAAIALLALAGHACSKTAERVEQSVAADMRPRVELAVDASTPDDLLPGITRMDICEPENAEHRWVFEHEMGIDVDCAKEREP